MAHSTLSFLLPPLSPWQPAPNLAKRKASDDPKDKVPKAAERGRERVVLGERERMVEGSARG